LTHIPGASVWEQSVYSYLVAHVENEKDIVDGYEELATTDSSAALRYLSALIVRDERRHHEVFGQLAESLRHTAELRGGQPPIPDLAGLEADGERIRAITTRFLAVEREDATMLEQLAHQLRDVKDTTLWTLLVELMQDDTRKHIRILEFLRDRTEG